MTAEERRQEFQRELDDALGTNEPYQLIEFATKRLPELLSEIERLEKQLDYWARSNLALDDRRVEAEATVERLEKERDEAERFRRNAAAAVVIAQEWIAEKDARIARLEKERDEWKSMAEQFGSQASEAMGEWNRLWWALHKIAFPDAPEGDAPVPYDVAAKVQKRVGTLEAQVARLTTEVGVHELASGLMAQLCLDVLEWYNGDDDLMPQRLVDQLTAEVARLLPAAPSSPGRKRE